MKKHVKTHERYKGYCQSWDTNKFTSTEKQRKKKEKKRKDRELIFFLCKAVRFLFLDMAIKESNIYMVVKPVRDRPHFMR